MRGRRGAPTDAPTAAPTDAPTAAPTPAHPCDGGTHACDQTHGECIDPGVSGEKGSNRKWQAQIQHNGQNRYLGYFGDEDAAARAYNTAATVVQTTGALPQQEGGRRKSSMHRGVSWSSRPPAKKWRAQIYHGGRNHYLGSFDDEDAAAVAYNTAAQAVQATGGRLSMTSQVRSTRLPCKEYPPSE